MRQPLIFVALVAVVGVVLVGTPSAAPPAPKGDITAVLAGSGIKVASTPAPAGSTGDVTVSLADCSNGQILKSGAPGTWSCAADATGAGPDLVGTSSASTEETTFATTCSDLATPGPSVAVDAPDGLIEVFAEVEAKGFLVSSAGGTAVSRWEVCVQVDNNSATRVMLDSGCSVSGSTICADNFSGFKKRQTTPALNEGVQVGAFTGFGSWLVVPVSGAGPHTVTLKYACGHANDPTFPNPAIPCDASHTATFRNRTLWVRGLG